MAIATEFQKNTGIHISDGYGGKEENMIGLTTLFSDNKYCNEHRKIKGSVCYYCYAKKIRKVVERCYKRNGDIVKNNIIPVENWPRLNCRYFRFESHGDIENETQVQNYFNMCLRNPQTSFALWTKNPFIIDNLLKSGVKKPKNLNIILSSFWINKEQDYTQYPWADIIFTVYDKNYAKENKIKINCGARNCFECGKCYKKRRKLFKVNELLK